MQRFASMLPGLEGLCFWEKVGRLGLYFLESRSLKDDHLKKVYFNEGHIQW